MVLCNGDEYEIVQNARVILWVAPSEKTIDPVTKREDFPGSTKGGSYVTVSLHLLSARVAYQNRVRLKQSDIFYGDFCWNSKPCDRETNRDANVGKYNSCGGLP